MHFHSLIAILVAAASHVVAEPIPPLANSPPIVTPVSNIELKSVGKSQSAPYWLEEIKHQGISAFHPDPKSYQVFRNVKDFGAKGTCHWRRWVSNSNSR